MGDIELWNKLTRREQRLVVRLFGGGSMHGADSLDIAALMELDLINEAGLTSTGLRMFVAAFREQRGRRAAA